MRLLRTLDRMPSHFRADENVILFGDVAVVFSVIIGRHGSGEPESHTLQSVTVQRFLGLWIPATMSSSYSVVLSWFQRACR